MKLSKIKLYNYRCFDDNEQIISIDDLTVFIGNNCTGKTAALTAINKIFAENPSDRNLQRSDFFLGKDISPEDVDEIEMYVECIFTFEETDEDGQTETYSIPPFYESLVVDCPDGEPYLRIRLSASWENNGSLDGSIESSVEYIVCPEETEISDDKCVKASRHDLDRIRMVYVPAIRNPTAQLKNISGTMMYRIMNSINWSESTNQKVKKSIESLNKTLESETGVSIVKNSIKNQWKEYDSDERYTNADLRFNSAKIDALIKKTEVVFTPTVTGKEYTIDEMGDGLKSLFYISLVDSLLDVETTIRSEMEAEESERSFSGMPPLLTIVAIEEPENHIAPHLVGKLVNELCDLADRTNAQVVVTSHSSAIVKRVPPERLRYFRMISDSLSSCVKAITLPDNEKMDAQYKYIKEAVRAYPEIYFAKLVILGEGDSEEIVLPKFIEAYSGPVDAAGISVVPLGGRYVNHFWRLLNDLDIPHITLLDLDRERDGGGWGRIKYALQQLIENGYSPKELLKITSGVLSKAELDKMHTWDVHDTKTMQGWIDSLEQYNIFFSTPLDLDFLMLESYVDEYKSILAGQEGPYIKGKGKIIDFGDAELDSDEYKARVECDIRNTLKDCGGDGGTYTDEQHDLMVWYTYFFLSRGKPSTHIQAISNMDDIDIVFSMPQVICKIIKAAAKILG